MNQLKLSTGTIRYREAGEGRPIVLVHGFMTNGELWREVTPLLAKGFRVIAPDWPLGSHTLAFAPDADLSPPGLASIIAEFLSELELEDVTLVGNDTGGALCQLVAVNHPERVGRLVLTPCDAYENFFPAIFQPLQVLAHVPGAVFAIVQSLRVRAARKLPISYGWLAKHGIEDDLSDAWLAPGLSDGAVRRDIAAVLRGVSKRYTLEAAKRFGEFDKPVLIAWAPEDRFFKPRYAERLRGAFPNAVLEQIEDSYTFVAIDQPQRTAELIYRFADS
jgi:pimeloyl-ACP methyl ester carboxylesterase